MEKWEIAVFIITVLSGVWAIIKGTAKTIKPLISQMVTLNNNVEKLNQELAEFKSHNHESHSRLWEHETKQDNIINNHETRLTIIERGNQHD